MTTTPFTFETWSCCEQPPGSITHPEQLVNARPDWLPAAVPGTVAGTLRSQGRWDISQPLDADARDWWYRTAFAARDIPAGQPCYLCFDGLATLAEVWLNGHRLFSSDNMFHPSRSIAVR